MAVTISSKPNQRVIEELKLLEKVAKNIIVGSKTVGDIKYTAVLIKGMPLSSKKFTVLTLIFCFCCHEIIRDFLP